MFSADKRRDDASAAEKRVHKRVQGISALDRLRTKIWVAEIERIASIYTRRELSFANIPDAFVFDELDGKTFRSIKGGVTLPSAQTVNKIAEGREILKQNSFPFRASKQLFDIGPDGFPLWRILAGDLVACLQTVDAEVTSLTGHVPDENSSFERRVRTLFSYRIPTGLDAAALWEVVASEKTRELHFDFNVIGLTAIEGDLIPGFPEHVAVSKNAWVKSNSVITLSAGQVISTIALYILSRCKNELVAPCHYMMVGVLQKALIEQLSYGNFIAEFLSQDSWAYHGLT